MRALEIFAALALAAILFIALKVTGMIIQVALFGALTGLVLGFVLARMVRGD